MPGHLTQSVCQRCLATANVVIRFSLKRRKRTRVKDFLRSRSLLNRDVTKCSVRDVSMNAVGKKQLA